MQHHRSSLALTAPVAFGYVPLGTVFGFLFVQAGAPWWAAILASIVVYAGASQYMMIPMIAAGASIGTIAFATLVINLRHVFYGLSLLQAMPAGKLRRWYLVFGLTDETFSILTTMPQPRNHRQMVLVTLINQGWWVLGTAIGALVGAQARIPLAGLDFVLAALFAVLAVEQWRARRNVAPLWAAVISYALAWLLAPRHALVIAIGLTLLIGLVLPRKQDNAADGNRV